MYKAGWLEIHINKIARITASSSAAVVILLQIYIMS